MTRLTRAKTALAVVCALFFLLGTGSTMAVAPLISLHKWWAPEGSKADRDWDEILGLTVEQQKQRDAVLRIEDAALQRLEDEIKRIYYPKIQEIRQRTCDRLRNEILDPEQRDKFDEYSTGKRKPPTQGK